MPNVIHDSTDSDTLFPPGFGRGFDVEAYLKDPKEMFSPPGEMEVYDESEWDALYDEQEARKSSLQHVRRTCGPNGGVIPSLDQNGQGYCWAYSGAGAVTMERAAAGMPYERLSGHAIGCLVKKYQDQGGWCGQSAKFLREVGVPAVKFWKEKSMSPANDTPEMRADAAKRKIVADWVDLTKAVYDQNLNRKMVATCLFQNRPVQLDFAWWGHSVLALRWVRFEKGSWGPLILNSWTDAWGDKGESGLQGSKAQWMGAVCTRATVVA